MERLILAVFAAAVATTAATGQTTQPTTRPSTPKAQADPEAQRLAARTLEAMGGRDAWDDVGVITWNFFGRRRHIWDRKRGLDRVDATDDEGAYTVVVDLTTREGRAWRNGAAVEDAEDRARMVDDAYAAWINDSYWLVMPYKLHDPGVRLKHVGPAETEAGAAAQRLEITFEGVGLTPENKYHVYVGDESGLVEQWDFFSDAADDEPRFRIPWEDWRQYGAIKLSGRRGERNGRIIELTDIRVLDEVPETLFTDATMELP